MMIKIFEQNNSMALEREVNGFLSSGHIEIVNIQYQPISLAPDPTAGWNTEYLYTVMIQYKLKTR